MFRWFLFNIKVNSIVSHFELAVSQQLNIIVERKEYIHKMHYTSKLRFMKFNNDTCNICQYDI